jgi:DNA-binding HxlR family transcriptional regulator
VKRHTFAGSVCPIARSLDVVGEWWTFLILRNVVIGGPARFDGLQRSLGISPNVLATRLARLVDEGILIRRRYCQHPPRDEYLATDKGRELLPVLVALAAWGRRWVEGEPEMNVLVHAGDHPVDPVLHCATCHDPVHAAHLCSLPPSEFRGGP